MGYMRISASKITHVYNIYFRCGEYGSYGLESEAVNQFRNR